MMWLQTASWILQVSAACLCLQTLQHSLGVIYNQFRLSLAQALSGTSGTFQAAAKSTTVRRSSSAAAKTAPGCGRDHSGHARLSFSISQVNFSVDAASAGAKRKLQSTPCSATDGTAVRDRSMQHAMHNHAHTALLNVWPFNIAAFMPVRHCCMAS